MKTTQRTFNIDVVLSHRFALLISPLVLIMGVVFSSHAGGIALGATRVIYPMGEKQVSLPITNSSESMVFLVQSWVANANGAKSADFVLTPPLFVMHPKKENTLRIMYVGPELPRDRESVFYLNSKAIPSVDKNKMKGNSLQIATQSVIKLFVRPKNLPSASVNAPKTLKCSISNNKVKITNPSPYFVSLVSFYIGKSILPNSMVPPKDSISINVPNGSTGDVTFQSMNDYGAATARQTCSS